MNRAYVAACWVLLVSSLSAHVDDPNKGEAPPAAPAVRSVAFSPDGKILVAAAGKKDQPGELVAWDADTRQPRWQRSAPSAFGSVSIAPDGKSLAVSHGKSTVLLLDLLAEELRLAQNALSEITGEFSADDLLGVIFSRFCIGK